MSTVDTSRFPLVFVDTTNATTLDGVRSLVADLDLVLARGETFGLVMLAPNDQPKDREKGVNSTLMTWVKQNKPRIVAQCAGLASIVESATQYTMYKPLVKLQGTRIYGCPTDIFRTRAEAEEWLTQRLVAQQVH